MPIAAGVVFEFNASATANNVNGGGFSPNNANFPTNLTTDPNTANTASPVVSSASYNFVAADVGHWLFIQSGTNWIAGWYKILSVASNKATIDAAIGAAVIINATQGNPSPRYYPSTAVGCATVGTPTSGTWGVDYSQGTTALSSVTDLACLLGTGTAPTVTSVSAPFGVNHIGNFIKINAGTSWRIVWLEIVNVVAGTATLSDTCSTIATNTGGTANYGGAISLNSTLDDDIFERAGASLGVRCFFKSGNFTMGESVAIAAAGNTLIPNALEGYNAIRGDGTPTSTKPAIALGALSFTLGGNWDIFYVDMTGTAASALTTGIASRVVGCKVVNTSTTANRNAIAAAADALILSNEIISYRGNALSTGSTNNTIGNYIHDSNVGIACTAAAAGYFIVNNILANNVTTCISFTAATTIASVIIGNTLYGTETQQGTGINFVVGNTDHRVINNIITGFVTGINHASTTQTVGYSDYNNFWNNTTDVTGWKKGRNDIAINPAFTNVAQLTGSTATTSGSVLTQSGADFSTVVDGQDFLYLVSGTGITAGIYGITSHTSDTLTLHITPGTNATADKVWRITTGRNFAIGTATKGLGFPAAFPAGLTTGYPDSGAVQRQEPSGAAGMLYIPNLEGN